VLDLGCGGGHDLAIASKLVGPSGTVFGIDLTQPMLDRTAATVEKFGDRRLRWTAAS
jgi:ubiquinone/menaquinone biosynthesis C-methylase UbiE